MILNTLVTYLIMYGIKSNLVILNGAGAVIFQREKQYTSYRYFSNLILIVGVLICATISYFLNRFVYSKFNIYYISETVNVVIAGAYNIAVSKLLKNKLSFNNYLYENSFSYAYDTVFIVSVLLMLEMNLTIVNFFLSLAMALVCIFVSNVLIGFFIKSLNREYVNISARNIAVRLFTIAIFSILIYYAQMLV